GETAPFLYFTSHSDADLIQAVREGRAKEFAAMWSGEPPDPQSPESFVASRLNRQLAREGRHGVLLAFYRELLRLRRELLHGAAEAFAEPGGRSMDQTNDVITLQRIVGDRVVYVMLNFGGDAAEIVLGQVATPLRKVLYSDDPVWDGAGGSVPELIEVNSDGTKVTVAPHACLIYSSQTIQAEGSEAAGDI
ncbi:MAG TPA: DUF3459 domain-containing protein, partial [Thermomicrobiaceae bacterium]|nr:DUF3459 domain-containing protein [Thermomicrobiaceae bacterium]